MDKEHADHLVWVAERIIKRREEMARPNYRGRILTHPDGREKDLRTWARVLNVSEETLITRIKKGMSMEDVLQGRGGRGGRELGARLTDNPVRPKTDELTPFRHGKWK